MTIEQLLSAAYHCALLYGTIGGLSGFSLGILIGIGTAITENDICLLPATCFVFTIIGSLTGISIGILIGLVAY